MAGSKKAASKKTSESAKKSSVRKKRATTSSSAPDAVDEQLERYRSMRDFKITAEPSGGHSSKGTQTGLPFCVQKHAASHLHYDFRLGWNGVLKSWAVAKGPSYFPGDKRLAVQVEDHPIEYGGFEGIIPQGQYGGGTVMLWDQGTWEPQAGHTDVDAGLRDGSLKFLLHGHKLQGKWALIRMGGKWQKEKKPNWLLIKEHDEFERGEGDAPVTEAEANSVITGRSIEEIARHEDHVWNSKDTRSGSKAWFRQEPRETKAKATPRATEKELQREVKDLSGERQPSFIEPQLATMGEVPPSGSGWLHELKLDGYRVQARKDGSKVQMLTRKGLDWTARMRAAADEIAKLPVDKATLDGEIVVVAPNGTTSFADLQASMQEGAKNSLTYFAFDLLHLDGKNTRNLPLKHRKELLRSVLAGSDEERVRLSEHMETGGAELLDQACKLQAEGIISKRATGKYLSGRGRDWLKAKCLHEQEFVVGGFTLPTNGIRGVGALLLGYYKDGKLIYAGRTGTGFTQKTHRMVRDRLDELAAGASPFETLPGDARRGAHWVKPEMVVQVRFATWTADDLVRQAAFLGVREDKPAAEVTREEPESSIGPRKSRSKAVAHRGRSAAAAKHSAPPAKSAAGEGEHAPVRLTHPEKILDEASGITKQMLADYYWAVAEHMLPHIANRPLSLVRCPDGAGKPCFFQKHVNTMLPEGISGIDIADKKGKVEPYITLSTPEALAGLAQLGVLEVHPWGSHNSDLEHPDRLIFDLDPDETLPWKEVVESAMEVKDLLKQIGLESFVKTTGGKGLHIVAPIEPKYDWAEIKEVARQIVISMEKAAPDRYLTKMTKAARKGKIYLDYLRNERGATSVAAYSPRARPGAGVSMPLNWSELKKMGERPAYSVANFAEWRRRLKKDPWMKMGEVKQGLKL